MRPEPNDRLMQSRVTVQECRRPSNVPGRRIQLLIRGQIQRRIVRQFIFTLRHDQTSSTANEAFNDVNVRSDFHANVHARKR